MGVGSPNDLRQQDESGIVREPVFSKDCVERNLFAVMPQLTAWHIVDSAIANAWPVGVMRKKNEFRAWINEFLDQPRTCDSIDFYSFSGDPFHTETSFLPAAGLP